MADLALERAIAHGLVFAEYENAGISGMQSGWKGAIHFYQSPRDRDVFEYGFVFSAVVIKNAPRKAGDSLMAPFFEHHDRPLPRRLVVIATVGSQLRDNKPLLSGIQQYFVDILQHLDIWFHIKASPIFYGRRAILVSP